jgi:hypothetical protein
MRQRRILSCASIPAGQPWKSGIREANAKSSGAAAKAEDRKKSEIRNSKSETNPNFVNFRMGETGEPDKPRENRRTSREKAQKAQSGSRNQGGE